jgi:hypothetical protein
MFFQPLAGWRHTKVTQHRKKEDFAECMRELVDVHFPYAEKIASSSTISTPIPRHLCMRRLNQMKHGALQVS